MIYLTTNNIPPHGPGGFISSLSFLRGFVPAEVRASLSLFVERGKEGGGGGGSRRKEDEKARGSKPGTSLPDNLLRE